MNVYFVRHGESENNAIGVKQGQGGDLSPVGKKQATIVAERFAHIPVGIILSSPVPRAAQTAEIIAQEKKIPVEFDTLLAERRNPSEFVGKNRLDPWVLQILEEMQAHSHDKNWYFSDEENFFDLKTRALKVLENVSERQEENILVVTHGTILRMLLACVIMQKDLAPKEYWHINKTFSMKNTGISLFRYENNAWRVIVWNDHAHLG